METQVLCLPTPPGPLPGYVIYHSLCLEPDSVFGNILILAQPWFPPPPTELSVWQKALQE